MKHERAGPAVAVSWRAATVFADAERLCSSCSGQMRRHDLRRACRASRIRPAAKKAAMSSIPPFVLAVPALAAVLGLIWLVQWLYRVAARSGWLRLPLAAGVAPASQRLALVQALPIDAKRRLHLVRCDGRQVL